MTTPAFRGHPTTMNKDAILATTIGLLLGLMIAGAFIFGPGIVRALPKFTLPSFSIPKPSSPNPPQPTSAPKEFTVTISAPLPDAVEPKKDVVVSGLTARGATVVIQGPTDEDIVIAGEDGAYAGRITATEGKNEITVTAYGESGAKQAQQSVTIYYTEENF